VTPYREREARDLMRRALLSLLDAVARKTGRADTYQLARSELECIAADLENDTDVAESP
jgi:hypothetical protein